MSNYNSLYTKNTPGFVISAISILMVCGFILISGAVGGILMKFYLGISPAETDLLAGGPNAGLVKTGLFIGQIGGTIVGLVILPIVFIQFLQPELKELIPGVSLKKVFPFLFVAILITFIILPLIGIIGDWNKNISFPAGLKELEIALRTMEDRAAQMTKLIVEYNSVSEMLLVLFTVAVLPAVGEELVFRGVLQNGLIKAFGNIHVAVFVSAAIFSFIHLQFFGFFPRMLLGIVLGYLYITSGNIMVSMLMHFINNAMVVLAMNLYSKGVIKMDPESSQDLPVASIYLSAILSSALLYLCWRMYKQRTESEISNV